MLFTKLMPQSMILQSPLQIDCDAIFVVVPDSNLKIKEAIYGSNILLTNCLGVVSPNKIIKIKSRTFNGKKQYLETKKIFQSTDVKERKLKVINTIPQHKKQTKEVLGDHKVKSFYFYDASIQSQSFQFLSEKYTEYNMFGLIMTEFEEIYNKLKFRYPEKQINFILSIDNKEGFLYQFLK